MADLDISQTQEAGNGNEALEKLNASAVDIMLCDINMPK
jgi:YesN/AraC family two-component response regulator